MRDLSVDIRPPVQTSDHVISYRERLFGRYATNWQEGSQELNSQGLQAHAKAYRYYLRGWLPDNTDASIVDVGCGRGLLLAFFKSCAYENVQGIDISPEQVNLARSMGVRVREGDAIAYLDAHPDMFDLLTCLDVLEHFHKPDVIRFLEAAHKALKPGGRLVLQTPNADSPWGGMHRYNDFTHEVGFNPNSLSRLLRFVGFTAVEAREMGPVPWGYSTVSTLRFAVWQIIRAGLKFWNLAETGNAGSGIFTRVCLVSASRR